MPFLSLIGDTTWDIRAYSARRGERFPRPLRRPCVTNLPSLGRVTGVVAPETRAKIKDVCSDNAQLVTEQALQPIPVRTTDFMAARAASPMRPTNYTSGKRTHSFNWRLHGTEPLHRRESPHIPRRLCCSDNSRRLRSSDSWWGGRRPAGFADPKSSICPARRRRYVFGGVASHPGGDR